MASRFRLVFLAAVLGTTLTRASEPPSVLTDELTLKAAGLSSDGPALLDFFRKRMQVEVDAQRLRALVKQLDDPLAVKREAAAGELVARGSVAVPFLRQAVWAPDEIEIVHRARRCLQFIEGPPVSSIVYNPVAGASYAASAYNRSGYTPATQTPTAYTPPALPAAAARLVAARKPPGAVEVLLAYLPHADDGTVIEEVKTALAALALRNGQPEPALVRGLQDPVALRSVTAAEVLCQVARGEPRPELRTLLRSALPVVRLRTALALADLYDEEAIPVLIAQITEAPAADAGLAEDYLQSLAGEQAPPIPSGEGENVRKASREAWARWWRSKDSAALLADFRKRTLGESDRIRAQKLIQQLGDDSFQARETATAELQKLGAAVVALLRQAANGGDLEVKQRAQKCLEVLDKEKVTPLTPETVRLVAYRKPQGAAAVLLGYLPLADDEAMAAEIRSALAAVAVRDGKLEPALTQALGDVLPLRRAAAAEALARAGPAEARRAVRPLLQDADLSVRQQAALALAGAGDRDAVPVLLDLLGKVTQEQGSAVEEFLSRIAGGQAPRLRSTATRAQVANAWAAWWKTRGAEADEAQLAAARPDLGQRQLGYTLLICGDNGTVQELGRDGKPRWQVNGLQGVSDVQVLPNGHLLVAEMYANRVSERTLKNEIKWDKPANRPLAVQRLPNGSTFVASQQQIVELDRAGREHVIHSRPAHDLASARKLRDGSIVCITQGGAVLRLDSSGKEVKSFQMGNPVHVPGGFDLLPNGHLLVALTWNNKIVEFDADGKTVWEAMIQQPLSAVRLPNGNTLVAGQNWPAKLQEIDRAGKVVWESPQLTGRPSRIKRR